MQDREALAALIDAAPISESDKARFLAELPSLSDEEVRKLGRLFAQEELAIDERLDEALQNMDAFLAAIPQTPDASGG